jgi:hypothetical protein
MYLVPHQNIPQMAFFLLVARMSIATGHGSFAFD